MLVEAYSPVAHGAALQNATLAALPAKDSIGIAQICIRYCLPLALLPLPKTANQDHMRSNAELDFVMSADDMAALETASGVEYGEASVFPVFGKARQSKLRHRRRVDGIAIVILL